MPKFTVEHKTSKAPKETYDIIKNFLSNDQDFQRIDPKMKCEFNDSNMNLCLVGSQFKADVKIAANGGSTLVSVLVDLPLLLTPFKGKVTESLQRKLAKYLG